VTRRLGALLVACAVAAAACGGSQPQQKLIGVTLLTQSHSFFKELEFGLQEEANARGYTLVIRACEFDAPKQASQIEDFVAQKVLAIVAAPCDSSALVPALAGPERAGIPVFTTDIAAHGGKVVSHIASDNVQGGALAAEEMAARLNGKGKIIIIDHPTVSSVQDRVRGFEEAMKKFPGITIVAKPSANGAREQAQRVMEDMLQAHRDLAGVFGINDDSALAAAGVIERAGRKDVVVIGFDATDEAQAAIRKGGPLKADVVQYPRKIGQTTMEMVARHLAGEQVPKLVPIQVGIWK